MSLAPPDGVLLEVRGSLHLFAGLEGLRTELIQECQQLMVLAHQDVIERLLDEESSALGELELVTGKPIRLQAEALYTVDQYDVVLM